MAVPGILEADPAPTSTCSELELNQMITTQYILIYPCQPGRLEGRIEKQGTYSVWWTTEY